MDGCILGPIELFLEWLRVTEKGSLQEEKSSLQEEPASRLFAQVHAIPSNLRGSLVAHRGFHDPKWGRARPLENTISAFKSAWKAGMKLCECDVWLSRDGELVLSHDGCLRESALFPSDPMASAPVASLALDQLRRVELLQGERVALLSEALELAHSLKCRLVVELKPCEGVGRAVAEFLQARPHLRSACEVVMSFDMGVMLEYLQTRDACNQEPPRTLEDAHRPLAMLLTTAQSSGDPEFVDLEACLEMSGDIVLQVKTWLDQGLDGIYIEWTPQLGYEHAAQLKQLCAACRAVGVWQYSGQPDCKLEAQRLKTLGVQYINTDLPTDF